jgi:hypothetical protein
LEIGLIPFFESDREVATVTYDAVVKVYNGDINICEKGLRLIVDETKKSMKISREVPLTDVADLSYIRDVQREMGIKDR